MRAAATAITSLVLYATLTAAASAPLPAAAEQTKNAATIHANGPAMWRLKKGDAEVWILGTMAFMPEGFLWDSSHLAETVTGADEVLLSPRAGLGFSGLIEMGWFFLTHWGVLSMPDDRKLEPSLPPELRARFVQAREQLGKPARRYEDSSPVVAAFLLAGDTMEALRLKEEPAETVVEKIARDKHVRLRRIAEYDTADLRKEILALDAERAHVCLANAVDDHDTLRQNVLPAARAWASGDIAALKTHYTTLLLDRCLSQSPSYQEINRRSVDESIRTIRAALSKRGKTVLLFDFIWLLRVRGVVEELKSEGVTVDGPEA